MVNGCILRFNLIAWNLLLEWNEKLFPCYYATYEILHRIDLVCIQAIEHTYINHGFHICLLKKALATASVIQPLTSVLTEEWETPTSRCVSYYEWGIK